jgi:hypothetical protein
VNIDTTKPTFGSGCPGPSTFLLNAEGGSHVFSLTATDGGSGLDGGSSVLTHSLNTTSVGKKTLTFSAVDNANNSASLSCDYLVQYRFVGFQQPIDNNVVNTAKAGNAVPIKYHLEDANGVPISDPTHFVSVTVVNTPNSTCTGTSDAIETYVAGSGLQYLGSGNWQFNWATPNSYKGKCKTMLLTLKDFVPVPTDPPALPAPRTARFQFK